jgi:hypothetical protein
VKRWWGAAAVAFVLAPGAGPVMAAPFGPPPSIQGGFVGFGARCGVGFPWYPSATLTFSWRRDGVPIAGAASQDLALASGDVGHSIECSLTGTAASGPTTYASEPVTVTVLDAPSNLEPPTIVDFSAFGDLICSEGAWASRAEQTRRYSWLRDGIPIIGAVFPSYYLNASDFGHAFTCRETRTNAAGSRSAVSQAVVPMTVAFEPPVPSVTGEMIPWTEANCYPAWGEVRWFRNGALIDASGLPLIHRGSR